MNTRLLLAPAAAGKTQYCIQRIQQVRREDPLAPIWVILPGTAEARAFRRRLAQSGGAIGVQTITFYALYTELLATAGQFVARLDAPILHRLLRAAVDEMCAAGELHYYAPLQDKPGFFHALRAVIQELKRGRVTSQAFLEAVAGHGPRLEELAAIYLRYQSWLYESPWADAEGEGWLAALALAERPELCAGWRLLVVDGFDQFNPTQLEVLRQLAGQAQETLVTLTGAEPARLAHRRFDHARKAVEATLDVQAQPLPQAHVRLAPVLARLEATLFEHFGSVVQDPMPETSPGTPTLLEAPTRAGEVRAALRWLKMRHVYDGVPLDELAILARDLERYRPFLEETAAEFGLPLHMAQGSWLSENPAVTALLDLLALPVHNWPRRSLVEAWRSPYFDWAAQGIGPGDADLLDMAARHGQVIAGLDQWRETLARLATAASGKEAQEETAGEDSDEIAAALQVPTGQTAAGLRDKLNAFVKRLTPPQKQATFREYTTWLEALVGDDPAQAKQEQPWQLENSLGIVHRSRHAPDGQTLPTAGRDVAALQRLKDVLRGLVFAESVLGQPQPIPYKRFWQELQGAVAATSYQAPAPDDHGAVLAAPVLAARGLSFRAVALLGLSEGEFPRPPKQEPLLRQPDRQALVSAGLPLEPRLLGDEVTIFYEAVTRAREQLLVTRPYLADNGQPWEASPYWEQLCQRTGAQPVRVRPEDPLPPAKAASAPEFLSAVTHALARPELTPLAEAYTSRLPHDSQLYAGWQAIRAGAGVLASRLTAGAQGPYEGDLSHLQAHLARVYGPGRPWSASRLETYAVCAYAFFTAYVLGFEPPGPVTAGYDVRQLGNMHHTILEEVFRRTAETGEAPGDVLPEIARQIFDAAPQTYGFRPTPLWARQREELEQILAATIEALVETSEGWRPAYFEPPFGLQDVPPLELKGADGATLRLRGYIDRVDVGEDGRLRIIDYKSGSTPISPRDLAEGKRVQLALYALAARDVLGLGEPATGMYWHIGSAKPSRLKLGEYEGGIEAALETAVAYTLSYAAGARQGRFAPRPPESGCPFWCPAADFCWRYTSRSW